MQVEVDVKHMQANFGGRGLCGFGVMAPFCLHSKRPNFPFGPWAIDVKHMQANFGGRGLSGFRVMAPFCLPS